MKISNTFLDYAIVYWHEYTGIVVPQKKALEILKKHPGVLENAKLEYTGFDARCDMLDALWLDILGTGWPDTSNSSDEKSGLLRDEAKKLGFQVDNTAAIEACQLLVRDLKEVSHDSAEAKRIREAMADWWPDLMAHEQNEIKALLDKIP